MCTHQGKCSPGRFCRGPALSRFQDTRFGYAQDGSLLLKPVLVLEHGAQTLFTLFISGTR